MDTDTRNRRLEALGIAESIAMRLREAILNENGTARFNACEYADMARTLGDIEDRLYRKGEYAPENVGSVRGGAR
jgi:hypothetical protein